MDCFNHSCPFRVNETSNANRCECIACPRLTMTKRDQMMECMSAIEDGMSRTAQHRDIWQNELIY